MKVAYFVTALAFVSLIACKTTKNTGSSATTTPAATTTPTATATTTTTTTTTVMVAAKPVSSKDIATEDLLKAAQAKWPDLSAKVLDEGKALYYDGACVNCHGAKKIVNRSIEEWPAIIDRMAPKSNITDAQKDAVLKYVLAVKMATTN